MTVSDDRSFAREVSRNDKSEKVTDREKAICRHCRSITSTHLRQFFAHITMLQRQSCNKLNNVWYCHVHIHNIVVVPAGLEHQRENQPLLMSFLVMGGVNGTRERRHFRFLLSRT